MDANNMVNESCRLICLHQDQCVAIKNGQTDGHMGRQRGRQTRNQLKHNPLVHSVAPCKSYVYYLLIGINSAAWKLKVMNLVECCWGHISDPCFCVSVLLSLQLCGYIVIIQSRVAISNWME